MTDQALFSDGQLWIFALVIFGIFGVYGSLELKKAIDASFLRPQEKRPLFVQALLWGLLVPAGLSFLLGLLLPGWNVQRTLLFLGSPVIYAAGLCFCAWRAANRLSFSLYTLLRILSPALARWNALYLLALVPLVWQSSLWLCLGVFVLEALQTSVCLSAADSLAEQNRVHSARGLWHCYGVHQLSPWPVLVSSLAASLPFCLVYPMVLQGFEAWSGLLILALAVALMSLLLLVCCAPRTAAEERPVLLFDLDGTLVDSQPLVFETFRRVFQQKMPEKVLSQEELYSFFGPTLEVTFARYFPKEEIEDVIDLYQEINLALHDEMIRPIAGAKETLHALHEKGYVIGIVSNKRKHVVEKGVQACGLGQDVDLIYGKEDLGIPKPDPEGLIRAVEALHGRRDNIIYTGDNPADMEAAAAMGAWSVGFTVDDRQKKALAAAHPCFLADRLPDMEVLLDRGTSQGGMNYEQRS